MTGRGRGNALDHVIVVVFENRSLDNVLGRLYGPDDGKTFEGVLGRDLSNPIPEWAEHGADRKVVPYTVATDMDSPNPDTGEEHQHTNTQLFNAGSGCSITGSARCRRRRSPTGRSGPPRQRPGSW
jgi:phospholipase C